MTDTRDDKPKDLGQDRSTEIALNVTRTRVTVAVFNLTIISLMLSIIKSRGATADHNVIEHLTSSVALFIGFCLTLLGILFLLASQNYDASGLSRPMPFALGTITTWLAISQTVTAFMHEYLVGIKFVVEASRPGVTEGTRSLVQIDALGGAGLLLIAMAGVVWIIMTYVAPLHSGLRIPIGSGRRWFLAGYYFALQAPIYWIYAKAWHLQYVPADQPANILSLFALQFVQPLLWFR